MTFEFYCDPKTEYFQIQGYVYFITWGDSNPVKIGWSVEPEERLKAIQTGFPYELRIVGVMPGSRRRLEGEIHRKLKKHNIRGEWFEPVKEVMDLAENAHPDWLPMSEIRELSRVELKLQKNEDNGLAGAFWAAVDQHGLTHYSNKDRAAVSVFIEKMDGRTFEELNKIRRLMRADYALGDLPRSIASSDMAAPY